MAILYSYPETLELLPEDMLIGTSTIRVAGKKKNITKNFTLELLKNFILDGNTGVQWGTITGTLSNQTDLQAALNAKQNSITLTTTGSTGPATLVGATLNVPDYSTGMAVPTLNQVLTAGNTSLLDAKVNRIGVYDSTELTYGYLSISDSEFFLSDSFGTASVITRSSITFLGPIGGFYGSILLPTVTANRTYTLPNATGTLALTSDIPSLTGYVQDTRTISTTTPLQGGGDLSANRTLSILQSNASQDGYLSSTDWNTFNNKQNAITLTTTGSSGSSTLVLGTLNVPTYTLSGLGGQPLATNLTSLSGLTYVSTSFVKMTAAGTFALDTNTYLTSAVTSVGMTVPSAFSVTPSTITSSGTFAITGAGVASQYVRGDGTLANFPTSTGGGASVSYYLNGSISQGTIGGVAYKEMNSVPVIGAGTDFTINADGYIAQFITDVGDPNKLLIPAGNWNFETYFSASSGGGSPRFYIELYKYDGVTFTLIATNSATPENITGGTSIDLYFTALAIPPTTLLATDRLAVRFYVIHSGRTITMHTENSHLSQIITTFSTGLTALNGLTSQVQYLAVGTTGTDFNISSATDTHTFNLPTASATNRGALSSADWSAFNGKFTLPSLTNGSVLFSNGTTIAQKNSNFFWDNTNNRLGIGNAAPEVTLDVTGIGRFTSGARFNNVGVAYSLWGQNGSEIGANGSHFIIQATNGGNTSFGSVANLGAKVGIKASGALSTDIALKIRNSADTADLLTIGGTGVATIKSNTFTGTMSFAQTANSTSVITGGPSGENITFGPSNRIFLNAPQVRIATLFQLSSVISTGISGVAGTDLSFTSGSTFAGSALNQNHLKITSSVAQQNISPSFNSLYIEPTINNTTTTTAIVRGIYYNPILTSLTGTSHRAIETVTGDVILGSTSGNVGIGTTAPVASAKVQIDSTTQGFLPPRMTNAQRIAIATPAVGLCVYCTDVVEGLYINKSTGWTYIG